MNTIFNSCSISDFNLICRLCLQKKENLKNLFEKDVFNCFASCCSLLISSDDNLPQNVCEECSKNLHKFAKFRRKIEQADAILREYLSRHNLQIENNTKVDSYVEEVIYDASIEKKFNNRQNKAPNPLMDEQLAKLMASAPNPMKKRKRDCKDATCHLCLKKFSRKAQLTRHLKIHINIKTYVCDVCNKAYVESGALQKHILAKHSDRQKPHTCKECGNSFNLKSTLERHMRTHTGEKPFGCPVCHKLYPSKGYLNRHKKIHEETRERQFICDICSKSYISQSVLKAHLLTHSQERPFQCQYCDKAFTTNGTLKSHTQYIHTKEKNYMCQTCAKTFVTKFELSKHLKRHLGEKVEPVHQCGMCPRKFQTTTHLKVHVRMQHTGERPFVCEICSKEFFTKQALVVHIRYHTGERPFRCSYCNKGFVTNEKKRNHERVHTGEKPYRCDVCQVSFARSSTFKTHIKIHGS